MKTSEFRYELPEASIAQEPVEPRHAARLLDTRDLSDHRFLDLADLLEPGDLVVVNRTRVRAARMRGHRSGGGQAEALLLKPLGADRWEALLRPARKLGPGTRLTLGEIEAEVVEQLGEGLAVVELRGPEDIEDAIARSGEVPLPPYFKGKLADPERYQTMFARNPDSAAAPTAGLHFTPQVVSRLEARDIRLSAVDLEVGLDTFRPITSARIEDHRIHRERYRLDDVCAGEVAAARSRQGRVVAIGTTVVRVLETTGMGDGSVEVGEGETNLYITPGYEFKVVDLMVTNFHLPGTTLIVLVAAFMGAGWRRAYEAALARGYRFLSFGDAMLTARA
ncbi:MAG TPA: tRNA preQ1(34) S-adenosylmethionine ribosyltransferase-isomerase QueA [Acidimicrobiia bacterium]